MSFIPEQIKKQILESISKIHHFQNKEDGTPYSNLVEFFTVNDGSDSQAIREFLDKEGDAPLVNEDRNEDNTLVQNIQNIFALMKSAGANDPDARRKILQETFDLLRPLEKTQIQSDWRDFVVEKFNEFLKTKKPDEAKAIVEAYTEKFINFDNNQPSLEEFANEISKTQKTFREILAQKYGSRFTSELQEFTAKFITTSVWDDPVGQRLINTAKFKAKNAPSSTFAPAVTFTIQKSNANLQKSTDTKEPQNKPASPKSKHGKQ